jgi:hypothetical protein
MKREKDERRGRSDIENTEGGVERREKEKRDGRYRKEKVER